ncbi:MAG: FAD-linked oxidase C-terminal domain-containing protein [Desulfovibrio sp.]|nr:FAD-linked oxidase C-terminal domain-containing protein [Desulfovibrio sp.]
MLNQEFVAKIEALLGKDRCSFSPEDLVAYSYDANPEKRAQGEGVVSPKDKEEVAAILKLAYEYEVPVTPRGGGSGYTGGCVPVGGGIVMAMDRFNKILEIDADNYLVIVEPGVVTKDLQAAVDKIGLMYPPDPASTAFSTIGGNIAENAGGIRAVKYGVTKHYVMGLEVVLPNGDIVKTGSKCIKDVAGYNLTELFVGSEGTLGVITKAVVKVVPKPEARRTMTATFSSLEKAAEAVKAIYATGVRPATMEFLDRISVEAVEKAISFGAKPEEGALLLIEVDGAELALTPDVEKIEGACKKCGVITFRKAETYEEREALWAARRALSFALTEIATEWEDDDVSVPIARIPQMIRKLDEIAERHDIIIANFGHYGDGNIHIGMTTGKSGRPFPMVAKEEVVQAVVELEGRIAAEHGIGCVKVENLHWNIDGPTMAMMRRFKNLFDPKGLLNPGKVIPSED